jgi:hypothetical protein
MAFANDQPAFEYFVDKGLTEVQAAGIVGNLDQESGVDPTIEQFGGGPGRGIAQWSVGGRWDTDPNDNVVDFAAASGREPKTLDVQLDFIWFELTTIGYGYDDLKNATTVEAAVNAFMSKYEICGQCATTKRIQYANDVLAEFGGGSSEDAGGGCATSDASLLAGLATAMLFARRRTR